MSAKIIHFRKKCIGCGNCVEYAEDHWKLSEEDGKADLIGGFAKKHTFQKEIDEIDVEQNQLASQECPVNIIHVRK